MPVRVHVLSNFATGQTHLGQAVFAARQFQKGDVVTQFTGPLIHKSKLPKKYQGTRDRYVQIGPEHFLGPSGDIDDLINHSCDPNTGLSFTTFGIILVAIKDIDIGKEITWDYSTTLFENSWKMRCDCREVGCRKIITDFTLLDEKVQRKYLKLNVIPPYIRAYLKSKAYPVYTKGVHRLKKYAEKK